MAEKTPEQELLEQLVSDKRSLRIQAIVKLTRIGRSQDALNSLCSLLNSSDREESFFVTQAVTKIAQRLGLNPNDYVKKTTNTAPSQNTNQTSNNNLIQITSDSFLSAKKENAPALLQIIRTKPNEIPEDVLPSVGVFLGKYGDSSDANFIVNYLKQHQDNLTLPYISAAEKIDPKILVPVLANLLASKEALVRSRAVMILRKIDSNEAERHFLNLLSSQQAENRLAALEVSFLFPFERVKDYVLSILQEEKDPDVLKASATLLASNPSQEVALRLLDILETLPPIQRKPITTIFNILSAALISAKVLPADEATPNALVATWKKLRLKNFLHNLEIQLCSTTGEKREAFISWIEKNKKIPEVSEFLEHLALNPQTEDVYQRLCGDDSINNGFLPDLESLSNTSQNITNPIKIQPKPAIREKRENKDDKADTNAVFPELYEINNQSENEPNIDSTKDREKEQILRIKNMEFQQFLHEKPHILDLAGNVTTPIPIRVEALNLLLKLSPDEELKNLALKALNAEDSRLKTSGYKILERAFPDILKQKLPELMLSNDTNIRIRAIRMGLKIDFERSVESLEKLLTSKDENNRSSAVSCLALCPFKSVYAILLKALFKETNTLVARQIGKILLSNPDPVVLYMLDKISALTSDPNLDMVVSKLRNELEELLSVIPENSKYMGLKEFDFVVEQPKKENKPYSVENVRKLTKKEKAVKKPEVKPSKIQEFFKKISPSTFILIVLAVLVGIGILFAILKGGLNIERYDLKNRQDEVRSTKKGRSKSEFKLKRKYDITGVITNISENTSFTIKYKKEEVIVKFKDTRGYNEGDAVNVTFETYRQNPNGNVIANGIKIKKADN